MLPHTPHTRFSHHECHGIILHSIPAKKGTEERIERYPRPPHPPFPNAKDTLTKHMTHTHNTTQEQDAGCPALRTGAVG